MATRGGFAAWCIAALVFAAACDAEPEAVDPPGGTATAGDRATSVGGRRPPAPSTTDEVASLYAEGIGSSPSATLEARTATDASGGATSTTATSTTATSTTVTSTTATSVVEIGTMPTSTTTLPPAPMTSCTAVAHIGDSTGVYLWGAEYVGGDVANTLEARYRDVGVDDILHDDEGGRAIVERLAVGREQAVEVARRIRASGFRGCWVLMIGTNDAANIAAGATIGAAERIGRMLDVVDGEPVLWVDAMTLRSTTAYRNDAMVAWNAVLAQFDAELDHLVVADWSARAQPGWYQPDGIHLTAEGRIWRAAITALELAEAFPAR